MSDFGIPDYLGRSGAGESSLRTYRKLLTRCEALLEKPLARATARDLGDLKVHLRRMRSGHNYAAELKRFYKAAGRTDLADLCVLKQRRHRLSPDDLLTLPEVNRLLEAAGDLRNRALIAVLWATGQRASAIGAIRLGDIRERPSDNGGAAFRIFFRTVKIAGEEHVGWVLEHEGGDHVRAWIKAHPGSKSDETPLFPSATVGQGRPLNESAILKIVQATARRAGLTKRVYPHLFRHSRATHLMRLGVPEAQIEKLLGWSPGSGMLARRYGHLVNEDAYRALLRANGLEPPASEDLGRLAAAEGELQPVVPMLPAAVPAGRAGPLPGTELENLLGDPKVARFLQLLQAAKAA